MQSASEWVNMRQALEELQAQCEQAEKAQSIRQHGMNERLRELGFVFAFLKLIARTDLTLEEAFREILDLIPPLWQYPDETCARIIYKGAEYRTTNFIVETQWRCAAEIIVVGESVGTFEVFYLDGRPEGDEGLLLWEETDLVEMAASGIGAFIERKQAQEMICAFGERLKLTEKTARETEKKLAAYADRFKKVKILADQSLSSSNKVIGNIGHELMACMNESVEYARECGAGNSIEEQRVFRNRIAALTCRLKQFAADIIEYADLEVGNLRPQKADFSLRQVIGTTTESFAEDVAVKDVEIVNLITPLVPDAVSGDPERLRQVLRNLMKNACAQTDRGEISVNVELEAAPHLLPIFHFVVAYSGAVIPEENQPSLFHQCVESYDKDRPQNLCATLELAIARQLVELMGGEIWVESPYTSGGSDKGGAAFHFTMWLDIRKPQDVAPVNWESEETAPLRMLIVDDNATNRTMLQAMLETRGGNIASVPGGKEALNEISRACETNQPFAVVLLDAQMPDLDGFETARKIQEFNGPERPVIILMSATLSPGEIGERENPGISCVIRKPIREADLLAAISSIEKTIKLRPKQERHDHMAESETTREAGMATPNDTSAKDILVVCADKITTILLQRLLEKRQCAVTSISNCPEMVDRVRRDKYAAVVIDMSASMVGMGEALRAIHEWKYKSGINMPIIGVTNRGDRCRAGEQTDIEIDELITITDSYERLYQRINELPRPGADLVGNDQTTPADPARALDRNKALAIADGDIGLLMSVLDTIIDENAIFLAATERAVSVQDWKTISDGARNLSRLACGIGADTIVGDTSELARLADAGDAAGISAIIERLKLNLQELSDEINTFEKEIAV